MSIAYFGKPDGSVGEINTDSDDYGVAHFCPCCGGKEILPLNNDAEGAVDYQCSSCGMMFGIYIMEDDGDFDVGDDVDS